MASYTYPDLSVACEKPQFADSQVDTLTNPTLLVEILSPSTENYDRGKKAKLYRAIPSLQELLFIAQDSYEVELYRQQPDVPACHECGSIMVRSAACYKCMNCGATSGCS